MLHRNAGFSEFAISWSLLNTKHSDPPNQNLVGSVGVAAQVCGSVQELPISTSSPINPRIVIPFSLKPSIFAVFECKSVPALFVPSSVIHPNAVAPCIPNCAFPIQLEIHSSSESTSA